MRIVIAVAIMGFASAVVAFADPTPAQVDRLVNALREARTALNVDDTAVDRWYVETFLLVGRTAQRNRMKNALAATKARQQAYRGNIDARAATSKANTDTELQLLTDTDTAVGALP